MVINIDIIFYAIFAILLVKSMVIIERIFVCTILSIDIYLSYIKEWKNTVELRWIPQAIISKCMSRFHTWYTTEYQIIDFDNPEFITGVSLPLIKRRFTAFSSPYSP